MGKSNDKFNILINYAYKKLHHHNTLYASQFETFLTEIFFMWSVDLSICFRIAANVN